MGGHPKPQAAMNMRIPSTSKIIGATATLLGCLWVLIVGWPLLSAVWTTREFSWFLIYIVPFMTLPGVLIAFFGFRLLRNTTPKNIKRTVGSICFFLFLPISVLLEEFPLAALSEDIQFRVSSTLALLVCLCIYVPSAALLLRHEGYPERQPKDLIPPWILFIAALQIWALTMSLFMAFETSEESGLSDFNWWFPLAGLSVPILLAWVFYRIALRILGIPVQP